MRCVIRQKFFALTDQYTIVDENEVPVYVVQGRFFSIGHKLTLSDTEGAELLRIEQRVLAWGPTYEIWRGDQLLATVKKRLFTLFRCRFSVDVPGPDDLEAAGDFLDHEYAFTRGDREVAWISKRFFAWTDTYGVDTGDCEDPALILASAIVIDLACHDDRND